MTNKQNLFVIQTYYLCIQARIIWLTPNTSSQNATSQIMLKAAKIGLKINEIAISKLRMFMIKLKMKYPGWKNFKCHEKAIPTIESAKNHTANKYAKVKPPTSS